MSDKKSKLCILPISRIKIIMKRYAGVENINNEATFLMTKAAEGLVAQLLLLALKVSDDKSQIDYPDLVKVTNNNKNFAFLSEIISPQIKGSEYLEILKKVEEDERSIAFEDSS